MTRAVFGARGLTKTYVDGEVEVQALRGLDIDVMAGEVVLLPCDEPAGALDSRTGIAAALPSSSRLVILVILPIDRLLKWAVCHGLTRGIAGAP